MTEDMIYPKTIHHFSNPNDKLPSTCST